MINIPQILMAIDTDWDAIFGQIGKLFTDFVAGDPILFSLIIFFFFLIITTALGLGMIVGAVILVPAIFLVSQDIPDLKIIVAIILGLLFGITLNKIVKR